MRITNTFATTAALISSTLAATVPSAPWSTLTPTGAIPTDASTDWSHSFGIQIETIEVASQLATETGTIAGKKRDVVNGLSDGQPNVIPTASYSILSESVAPVAQITDGQIQHQTTAAAASVVNQITDGQIQHQTTAAAASVVNQMLFQQPHIVYFPNLLHLLLKSQMVRSNTKPLLLLQVLLTKSQMVRSNTKPLLLLQVSLTKLVTDKFNTKLLLLLQVSLTKLVTDKFNTKPLLKLLLV
ncbi:protein PIR3 precursor [Lodderomyces elongisporus NRRL YB-4239]|uniref:Protein PIR3 n=1 Tax=Lodderomyces elongisporus (strain ATCC 11503 / CBS 2605 / JCM 1781 / NBRC 1676 / NRRL YB-4239) TaxID=379508 RepID=A5DYW2_LODEL|nr:protein PIR3 precursor [Lodderomyces elongisporus NRRL YB-4239]